MRGFGHFKAALERVKINVQDVSAPPPQPVPDLDSTGHVDDLREDSSAERDNDETRARDVRGVSTHRGEPSLPLVPSVGRTLIRYPHLVAYRLGAQMFGYSYADMPTPVGLIIGECPGNSTDPRLPLFPHPENSAGARLLGYSPVSEQEYLGRAMRTNLCPTSWNNEIAAMRVQHLKLAISRYDRSLRILLLGKKVMLAWNIGSHKKFDHGVVYAGDTPLTVGWIPHPSGLNRVYNETENQVLAGQFVQWVTGGRKHPLE